MTGGALEVWRAPIDNDAYGTGTWSAEWRRLGLDRMVHRLDAITAEAGSLVVDGRTAPAGRAIGLRTRHRWTPTGADEVLLELTVTPEGLWPDELPLPRLGVLLALPAEVGQVTWFGRGPGEAYADSHRAARIGRFSSSVEDMHTRYLHPQENGHRIDVRSALVSAPDGSGLAIEGAPVFGLTVRRWTTADLEAARHDVELQPRDQVFVTLDRAQNGVGNASCGPNPPLPQHRFPVAPTEFAVTLRRKPAGAPGRG